MRKKARTLRPSPAMIVACLALVAALGGTAIAGGVLNKKKVNKIITNRAPGLSVAKAKNADNASNADKLGGLGPNRFVGGFLRGFRGRDRPAVLGRGLVHTDAAARP